jgi:hypothetical protein
MKDYKTEFGMELQVTTSVTMKSVGLSPVLIS